MPDRSSARGSCLSAGGEHAGGRRGRPVASPAAATSRAARRGLGLWQSRTGSRWNRAAAEGGYGTTGTTAVTTLRVMVPVVPVRTSSKRARLHTVGRRPCVATPSLATEAAVSVTPSVPPSGPAPGNGRGDVVKQVSARKVVLTRARSRDRPRSESLPVRNCASRPVLRKPCRAAERGGLRSHVEGRPRQRFTSACTPYATLSRCSSPPSGRQAVRPSDRQAGVRRAATYSVRSRSRLV